MRLLPILPLLIVSVTSLAIAAPPLAPTQLRVNDVASPVGTGDSIAFGWQVNDPDDNEIQSQYQILVATSADLLEQNHADVWDSGPVQSRRQSHVSLSGYDFESDTPYFWKVRTWDKDGNPSPYSETQSFTVGLLENADWQRAEWIRRESYEEDEYAYFRKAVSLEKKGIQRATAYISGTHKYALHLNGSLVGKGPAYHYPEFQYYNTFDVTELLESGSPNQLAIFNHWFGGGQGRPAGEPGVILKLIVHYQDGKIQEVNTDGTWVQRRAESWVKGQPHRNRGEGVGYVEKIDSRLLQSDWHSLEFDDSDWEKATVVGPHPSKPWTGDLSPDLTRIIEYPIAPEKITQNGDGRYLIDLGKVYPGMPQIQFDGGEAGTEVKLLGGYALDASGEIDVSQNQVTDLSYYAILNGNSFTFTPNEYVGLRYLQVENAPMPITEANVSFIVRHSELEETASSFDSSNETLNAVWGLMKHSLYTCAQEEFVDTPTREKGGFLGDAAIQSAVAMPVLHERTLTRRVFDEYLQSMTQHWSDPENRGRLNAVYPNNDGARDIPDYNQAFLPWAWNYYMETGDIDFLDTNYERLKDVADYNLRHIDPKTGLIVNLTGGAGAYRYGIIDWPASMRFGYDMETAARTVINCWGYLDFRTQADIAAALGNTADHEHYNAKAEALADAINSHLLSDNGLYIDGLYADGSPSPNASQHSNMFPLALGIVPVENRESVLDHVKQKEMSVGMITVRWLIQAIGENEDAAHLIELFTNPNWNGWANCLAKGATATWESWFADTGRGESQSHAWGAIGLEGYIRYILGVRALEPQYEKLEIRPLNFGDSLDWAKGHITTEKGIVSVEWAQNEKGFEMSVELPTNATATISIPRSDSQQSTLLLNGESIDATSNGNYLTLQNIGSGQHTIQRQD